MKPWRQWSNGQITDLSVAELEQWTDKTVLCDLFEIRLLSGVTLRLSTHHVPLYFVETNTVFQPAVIRRAQLRVKTGLEVDAVDVMLSDLLLPVGSMTAVDAFRLAFFDGAHVRVWSGLCMETGEIEPCGGLTWAGSSWASLCSGSGAGMGAENAVVVYMQQFVGRVADAEADHESIRLRVVSNVEQLNIPMPRHVYQPACQHTLYDKGCNLARSFFARSGVVTGASTRSSLATGLTEATGHFDLGTITFTSGANAGLTRSIKKHVAGNLVLSSEVPLLPAVGDAFVAYPGCDKRSSTCQTKFNNLPHFRGFPYVPTPETAY